MVELQVRQVPREHPRVRTQIPVVIEVAHAWESQAGRAVPGTLFNVSRGGGGIRAAWVVPPRTLLTISVPAAPSPLRLTAEVVWTSATPGAERDGPVYGIRWTEFLSRRSFETMAPAECPGPEQAEDTAR
jgi:hypothetical protein